MSRERIVRIAVLFAACAVLLGVALFRLQVVEHDVWLERSYRNRWDFRDVPTRRGEIVDRHGVPLAWDAPGFDLELTYLTFRRGHPVGLVRHGADLMHTGRVGVAPYSFARPAELGRALEDLLRMPVAWLRTPSAWPCADRAPGYPNDLGAAAAALARDVRIQAVAAVAELTGAPRSRLALAFLRAVDAGDADGTVVDVLARVGTADAELHVLRGSAAELEARLRELFAARLEELAQLEARLLVDMQRLFGAAADRGFELFVRLEVAHRDWVEWRRLAVLEDDAERGAFEDADFWRFLAQRGQTWKRWGELLELPAARRAALVDAFVAARDERVRALEAARADAAPYVDAARVTRSEELLFPELPETLEVPRFRDEARPVRIRSRISHEVAVWIALLDERHAGLSLRPSVRRERGKLPDRDDLSSLADLVGVVGTYQPRGRSPALDAMRRLGTADEFARLEAGLPDDLEVALRRSAAGELRRHFAIHGRLGRYGIEAAMDDVLSGWPGLRFVEQDKRARETRMFDRLDVSPGELVTATIDVRLQRLAEDVVGTPAPDSEVALALVDPRSGDVLALVGRRHVSAAADPDPEAQPLAWTLGAMPPKWVPYVGSVAKPLVALEYLRAVRAGGADAVAPLIDPARFQACAWRWEPDAEIPYRGRTLYCSSLHSRHDHGDEARSTSAAIAQSCNIYFFEAASRLGAAGLRRAYAQFGWHPAADGGEVADGVWQDRMDGTTGRLFGGPRVEDPPRHPVPMQGIGYGLQVWPVFVARAYAGIATGALPRLRVVREVPAESVPLPYTADELAQVRAGLALCVTEGTARGVLAEFGRWLDGTHGVSLCGKTGTAEVLEAHRDPDGYGLNNAWFAGYVGDRGGPRLAFAAVVYRTRDSGGQVAAPLVRGILERIAEDPELCAEYLHGGAR